MIQRKTMTKGMLLLLFSGLLVGIQLFGGLLGQIAAAVGALLVIALAFAANSRYLGALLLLCLPSYGIRQSGEGSYSVFFPESVISTPFLGLDWPAGLALMVGAFARVLVELAVRPSTFSMGGKNFWLLGFMAAVLIALYAAILGYLDGYNRATSGVRGILALGGYFWGIILVNRTNWKVADFAHQLNLIVLAGAFLMTVGLLRGHVNFLLFGLFGGLLLYWLIRKQWIYVVLGSSGISLGLLGTLTTAAIPLVALLLSLIIFFSWFRMRRLGVTSYVIVLTVVSLSTVAVGTVQFSEVGYEFLGADRADGIGRYAALKLYSDRSPLWSGAIDVIRAGPYVFVPSGRSIIPAQEFGYEGVEDWRNGAHNTVLELFLEVGVVAGFWGAAFMFFVIWKLRGVAIGSTNGFLRGVAAGVIGTVVVGMTTGNFPVQDVGFLIWALAGWAVAVRLSEESELKEFSNAHSYEELRKGVIASRTVEP